MAKRRVIKKARRSIFTDRELALLAEINIHISNANYYSDMSQKSIAVAKRFMRQLIKREQ